MNSGGGVYSAQPCGGYDMRVPRAVLVLALACSPLTSRVGGAEIPPSKPLDIGGEERVEVRLVTVDAVVLDAQDRTVPGLTAEDFTLTVDGKAIAIDTFDQDCPIGAVDDPKGVSPRTARPATVVRDATRRIVIVLDYYHVAFTSRAEVFQNMRDLVGGRLAGDEELMLVALANGVRVEQPFTRDREAFLKSLRRMEVDVSLWNADYGHLTERPIFDGLEALYQILADVPGPKAAVLFSDGRWPSTDCDPDFNNLAALAGNARVSLYPVVASGLIPDRPT